jgi:uncharacterized protein (TIGR03437 family)
MRYVSIKPGKTTGRLILILALFIVFILPAAPSLRRADSATDVPSLSGAAAVVHLKEQKLYSGLAEALRAARDGDGAGCDYVEQQKLTGVGAFIALSGDTAVIGSPGDDVGNNQGQGSAYVFVRSGAAWLQQQRLFASDGAARDQFGSSVSVSGNYLVVGAIWKQVGSNYNQGAAYVFVRSGATWIGQQRLTAPDGAPDDNFGRAVAINDGRVAVGATQADISGRSNQGAVYLFTRSGSTWTQETKLTADDGLAGESFGASLSLSNFLLVGAPNARNGASTRSGTGAAYVFASLTGPWAQRAKLLASDGETGDGFGAAVAADGNTAVIGAPGDKIGANDFQGSAYVFFNISASFNRWSQQAKLMLSSGAAWSLRQPLTASDASANGYFGGGVALGGDAIIVSAWRDGGATQGTAYFFRNCDTSPVVVSVSAASFASGSGLAPESIAAAFGSNLAGGTQAASAQPLPTELAGASVRVRDSAGVERLAPLFFVSPGQINYQVPPGTASGPATVTVTNGANTIATGVATIANVAPGLFSANSNGRDVAAANAVRVRANGSQQFEAVARFDSALNRFVPVPIDLGPEGDVVFLVLYGTGLRFRNSLSTVNASIGGVNCEVLFAGAAPGFVGLDQINVRLSRSLAGRGEVDVALVVDGKAANTVRVSIR